MRSSMGCAGSRTAQPRSALFALLVAQRADALLRERLPQVEESLARTARLLVEASTLLDELAMQDLAQAGQGEALGVGALQDLAAPRRHNLLRYWLRQQGFEMPSADTLERVEREVLDAAEDAEPLLAWAGCELRRYRDRLYAMAPLPPPPARSRHWPGSASS